MDILEACNLYGSYRAAAKHVPCSSNTVKKFVLARDAGDPVPKRAIRAKLTDDFLDKIDELVDRTEVNIMTKRSTKHSRPWGFVYQRKPHRGRCGKAKSAYAAAPQRGHKPWVPTPGQRLQYDFGDAQMVNGQATVLFVAWPKLWSVIPLCDK